MMDENAALEESTMDLDGLAGSYENNGLLLLM